MLGDGKKTMYLLDNLNPFEMHKRAFKYCFVRTVTLKALLTFFFCVFIKACKFIKAFNWFI